MADNLWIHAVAETVASYRRMVDAAVVQLTDEELWMRPAADMNSVAVLLRHIGGNLRSRWTDFQTTDGEKPNRHRDLEFQDWEGDRESLLNYFDDGWSCLVDALEQVSASNIENTIYIRGEEHSIPMALARSVTHLASHVGQIQLIARLVHAGEWKWLSIPPGKSAEHNKKTWGTPASRSVYGEDESAGTR